MAARFLVIEDNAANLELMGYLLRAHGYEVEEATCGELGLELAVQQPFDLIICDVQLPGIDGYQLVGTLKSDARLRRVQTGFRARSRRHNRRYRPNARSPNPHPHKFPVR